MELFFVDKNKSHKLLELCIVSSSIKPAKWQLLNYLNIWGNMHISVVVYKTKWDVIYSVEVTLCKEY